jgi:hypothetical protein
MIRRGRGEEGSQPSGFQGEEADKQVRRTRVGGGGVADERRTKVGGRGRAAAWVQSGEEGAVQHSG